MRDKTKHQKWYRGVKTTPERRANSDPTHLPYVRGRRRPAQLPSPWDDYPCCHQRTWKAQRTKQYRPDGRGKEHKMVFPARKRRYWSWRWREDEWLLEEYLKEHNIPHRVTNLGHRVKKVIHHQKVYTIVGWKKVVTIRKVRKGKKNKVKTTTEVHSYYRPVYGWKIKKFDKPREYWVHVDEGTEVVWWYDKDIGIEHILRKQ